LEADPEVRASGALASIAAAQYGLELDKAGPKFTLGLTPLSYDARRAFDFSKLGGSPPYYADTGALSLGGGLNYSQVLPTAGSLSAGVKSGFSVTDKDGGIEYAVTPSLSASLRQPLFAVGEFLPFGAATAARRSVAIVAEQAALDDRARRNQAVRAAVEIAGRVLVLRRTLAVQEASLSSALGRAESFGLRRSAGTTTEDAALESALSAELVRQSLLDTRLSLREAERRLASVLGLEPGAGGSMILPPLSDRVPSLDPAVPPVAGETPDAARAALSSEKARTDAVARSTIDVPILVTSLAASPRYPDSRGDPSDPGTLISDFADTAGGAGLSWNVSLTLDVPLSAGASREYRRRIEALSVDAADAQLAQAERATADRAASLAGTRDALRERLSIQRRIAELNARKADRAAQLAAAGTLTSDDVASARSERDRAFAEALRVELDLLLSELDLRALAGDDLAAALAGAR
jgi:outer membrane protein TolC